MDTSLVNRNKEGTATYIKKVCSTIARKTAKFFSYLVTKIKVFFNYINPLKLFRAKETTNDLATKQVYLLDNASNNNQPLKVGENNIENCSSFVSVDSPPKINEIINHKQNSNFSPDSLNYNKIESVKVDIATKNIALDKAKIIVLDNLGNTNLANSENINQDNPENINQDNPRNTNPANSENINQDNPENINQDNPRNTNPANPRNTNPANLGNINQDNPENKNLANSGNINLANSGNTNPANPRNINPANSGNINPANSGNINPANPGNTNPANPGNTKPANPRNTKPANPGNTKPANLRNTKPANSGNINQDNSENTNLANSENTASNDDINAKQLRYEQLFNILMDRGSDNHYLTDADIFNKYVEFNDLMSDKTLFHEIKTTNGYLLQYKLPEALIFEIRITDANVITLLNDRAKLKNKKLSYSCNIKEISALATNSKKAEELLSELQQLTNNKVKSSDIKVFEKYLELFHLVPEQLQQYFQENRLSNGDYELKLDGVFSVIIANREIEYFLSASTKDKVIVFASEIIYKIYADNTNTNHNPSIKIKTYFDFFAMMKTKDKILNQKNTQDDYFDLFINRCGFLALTKDILHPKLFNNEIRYFIENKSFQPNLNDSIPKIPQDIVNLYKYITKYTLWQNDYPLISALLIARDIINGDELEKFNIKINERIIIYFLNKNKVTRRKFINFISVSSDNMLQNLNLPFNLFVKWFNNIDSTGILNLKTEEDAKYDREFAIVLSRFLANINLKQYDNLLKKDERTLIYSLFSSINPTQSDQLTRKEQNNVDDIMLNTLVYTLLRITDIKDFKFLSLVNDNFIIKLIKTLDNIINDDNNKSLDEHLLTNNSFIVALVYHGEHCNKPKIQEQTRKLYANYLKSKYNIVKDFEDFTIVFGNIGGVADFDDKSALNYVFISKIKMLQLENGETIHIDGKKAKLRNDNRTIELDNGKIIRLNDKNKLLDDEKIILLNDDIISKLLNYEEKKDDINFLNMAVMKKDLILNEYESLANKDILINEIFTSNISVFKNVYKRLNSEAGLTIKLILNIIGEKKYKDLFASILDNPDGKNHQIVENDTLYFFNKYLTTDSQDRTTITDDHLALIKKHYNYNTDDKTDTDIAELLMAIGVVMTRLSSKGVWGKEGDSPFYLRLYAGAILTKAYELDSSYLPNNFFNPISNTVINPITYKEKKTFLYSHCWVHRLLGTAYSEHDKLQNLMLCSDSIHGDMTKFMAKNAKKFAKVNKFIPSNFKR